MGSRLSSDWVKNMREEIENTGKVDHITGFNPASKWLICILSEKEIPFKVIHLGSGVKRITTKTETCPKCNGTGKC